MRTVKIITLNQFNSQQQNQIVNIFNQKYRCVYVSKEDVLRMITSIQNDSCKCKKLCKIDYDVVENNHRYNMFVHSTVILRRILNPITKIWKDEYTDQYYTNSQWNIIQTRTDALHFQMRKRLQNNIDKSLKHYFRHLKNSKLDYIFIPYCDAESLGLHPNLNVTLSLAQHVNTHGELFISDTNDLIQVTKKVEAALQL